MTISMDSAATAQRVRPLVVDVRLPGEPAKPSAATRESSNQVEPMDPQRVAEAARQVEELFQTVRRSLQFRDDPTSGRMVVSVIDAQSGEVIRQIPPEQMVRMAANLEQLSGILLGERA